VHQPRQRDRAADANHTPTAVNFIPRPNNELENVSRRGAQRHAHTDLVRSRLHQKRHHAINSDQRQHQRAAGKDRKQRRVQTRLPDRFSHDFFHRRDFADRQIRIELRHFAPNRAQLSCGFEDVRATSANPPTGIFWCGKIDALARVFLHR
jgi:hypothetical protein